jgi:putative endonuclease
MPLADMRRQLGDFGEAAAAAFLIRQGYVVRERQWRCRSGEIDLIARQGDQVIFVEVRTRRDTAPGSAEESITPAKQQRLVELAYMYLEAHALDEHTAWRIDVIVVRIDRAGRIVQLTHIPHAVEE